MASCTAMLLSYWGPQCVCVTFFFSFFLINLSTYLFISTSPSVCLSTYFIERSIHSSILPPTHSSVRPLSVRLSLVSSLIYLPTYLPIYLFFFLKIYTYIYRSVLTYIENKSYWQLASFSRMKQFLAIFFYNKTYMDNKNTDLMYSQSSSSQLGWRLPLWKRGGIFLSVNNPPPELLCSCSNRAGRQQDMPQTA